MTVAPHEAVEFARMVTRAFHPAEYVVALDGVLRGSNYCAHKDLSNRLKIAPKQLRATLVRMAYARLVKCEKRMQKQIKIRRERRQTRTVHIEFWFVPLREVVDAFVFRMHRLDAIYAQQAAERWYRCERCSTIYNDIDVLRFITPDRAGFVCERFGMTSSRKPGECGGSIMEEDNTVHLEEAETLKRRLDVQLRPLRERAEKCMRLSIPAHPLQDADAETWGEIVPENTGIRGENVDKHGELQAQTADVKGGADVATGKVRKENDSPIPDTPSWFKDSSADEENADGDWGDDNEEQNARMNAMDTTATFGDVGDAKSYYEHFMRQAGGTVEDPLVATDKVALEDAQCENVGAVGETVVGGSTAD